MPIIVLIEFLFMNGLSFCSRQFQNYSIVFMNLFMASLLLMHFLTESISGHSADLLLLNGNLSSSYVLHELAKAYKYRNYCMF